MSAPVPERTAALAGLFQAVRLVDSLAVRGTVDVDAFETTIRSVYTLDADSVAACYGGELGRLELGRETLEAAICRDAGSARAAHYAFTLMSLERGLARRRRMRERIATGIRESIPRIDHFGPTHDRMVARLAELYAETLSSLRPRVLVRGTPLHLQQDRVVARIRALLLAGVRSAVLWRQLGGARWHLLFRRARIADELRAWQRAH